ncbi:MAG TPA: hypothetical protein VFF06_10960 [Polyangia bacterium]|nr:hypothetical protein [Polyangia bacterium]
MSTVEDFVAMSIVETPARKSGFSPAATANGMPGHNVGRRWEFKPFEVDARVRAGSASAVSRGAR